jgi:hypothetical protein
MFNILGFDLLHHLHALLDLGEYSIMIGGEKILANGL